MIRVYRYRFPREAHWRRLAAAPRDNSARLAEMTFLASLLEEPTCG
jgi:hypothetical protein